MQYQNIEELIGSSQVTAVINYGDPLKNGGYSTAITGTREEIRQEALDCIDAMWHRMNCNGNPYCNIKIGDYTFNQNWQLLPPSQATGSWLRSHANLMPKCYFNTIALKMFRGRPSASNIRKIKLDLVLDRLNDEEVYSHFLSREEEIELCQSYSEWVRFEVV